MNFNFSEDQLLMKEEVKKLLDKENSVKRNRNIFFIIIVFDIGFNFV